MSLANTPMNSLALYHQLGAHLAAAPDLTDYDSDYNLPLATTQWLAKACALVRAGDGIGLEAAKIDAAVERLVGTFSPEDASRQITLILHRVHARLEIDLPAESKGAFISAGDQFDGFSAIAKLLGEAKSEAMIIDPYLDGTVIIDFAGLLPEGVGLQLLTDYASYKPAAVPAAEKWISQHGTARPLELRAAPARSLHDRLIIIDGTTAWIITQSLKDFAKRSHATIQKADREMTSMKVSAYGELWQTSVVLASVHRQ